MSISYKQLWQEERQRADNLAAQVTRLAAELEATPDEVKRELLRTREVVDLAGIAWHMKVERHTPQQWRQRGLLPEVDFPRIKEPLWYATTIKEKFAGPTRRLWFEDPDNEDLSPAA